MTFTDRAILVGLVALAIPLLLHLLGRRRARKVELPTARFAEGAHASARGRLWVKRLGLLALRLAAVALVVLALAGPHVGGGSAPAGRWILVLDASASMRARDRDGRTAFDRSRTRLDRILRALADEAEVTLALTDGRGAAGSPDEVRRTLDAVADPGWGADTLGRTIREVLAASGNAAEAAPAHVILATDATPAALADLAPGAFADAPVEVSVLLAGGGPNAWLGPPEVTVSPAEQGRGHVLAVAVEARAAEAGGQVTVRLDLADPALRSTSRSFPGRGRARFRQPVPGPGPWQGRVRLTVDDALPADNVRYFTAAAAQAVHVLVVDAAEEPDARVRSADLVEAAFAGETDAPKHVTRRPAGEVRRANLASADLVFWVGPKPPARDGLLAGPRPPVVWVPADAAPPAAALAEALGLSFGEAETVLDGTTIDPAGYTSDLLAAFEGGTSGDLAAPVFRRRLGWAEPLARASGPAAHSLTVAARFRDGAPAILARRDAGEEMVALAVGPAPCWGDLASRPEWVVLAHSLVEGLAPAGGIRTLNLTVAEAARRGLTFPAPDAAEGPAAGGEVAVRPGNYARTDPGGRPVRWSVNLDPAETVDLAPAVARLESAFAKGTCRVVRPGADPLTAIPGLAGPSGRDLTPMVVLLLAAVLAAEGLVAWWASPRRRESRTLEPRT